MKKKEKKNKKNKKTKKNKKKTKTKKNFNSANAGPKPGCKRRRVMLRACKSLPSFLQIEAENIINIISIYFSVYLCILYLIQNLHLYIDC